MRIALLFLLSLQSWGAVVWINDTTCSASNSTTCAATMDANPTAGNALVASIARSNTTAVSSVSGGCSATWTLGKALSVVRTSEIWYCLNATGGSTTITITWPSKSTNRANFSEYSGVATSSVLDVTGSNSGFGTGPATGDINTTNADDLLLAALNIGTSAFVSGPTNSFTALTVIDGFHRAAYRIVGSTGTYSTGWTYSASQDWEAVIVALKAAAAGGTVVKDVIRRGVIAAPR